MLSDTIIDQNYHNERFTSQLKKLEHISTNMSELANNGDIEKIVHLDKLRKKILIDIQKGQVTKTETNQNKIKKIISINDYIVKKLNHEKSKRLDKLNKQSKSIQSYIKFL